LDRLYYLEVTTPANTPLASPQSTLWPLEDNYLKYVDVLVPPGPSGLLGFRLMWANQQVIPWGNDSWLITDNERVHVDCDFMMTITGLVIESYNTDIYAHTIYIRGLVQTATVEQELAASELTGSIAVPASQDLTEIGGIQNYTALPVDLSGGQDYEDENIGEDTGEIEPITTPPLVTVAGGSSPPTTPSKGKLKPKPVKPRLPVRLKR
jgi:hypothetical protein